MFNLRRLIQFGKSKLQPRLEAAGHISSSGEPVTLVAITQSPDDYAALRQIAADNGWKLSIVASSAEAIALLKVQPTPLVICDREISGEDWREALARIAGLPQAVCVLLASRVVDEYLWHQVIENHGYDVVAKPFQAEALRRAVTFAWSWRGWAHLQDRRNQA